MTKVPELPEIPAIPAKPARSGLMTALMVILGLGFIALWLVAAVIWAYMSFMGGMMANDSGRIATEVHSRALMILAVGEVLVAVAGVLAGLSFFWVSIRVGLLWAFGGLLLAGGAMQIWAFWRLTQAS